MNYSNKKILAILILSIFVPKTSNAMDVQSTKSTSKALQNYFATATATAEEQKSAKSTIGKKDTKPTTAKPDLLSQLSKLQIKQVTAEKKLPIQDNVSNQSSDKVDPDLNNGNKVALNNARLAKADADNRAFKAEIANLEKLAMQLDLETDSLKKTLGNERNKAKQSEERKDLVRKARKTAYDFLVTEGEKQQLTEDEKRKAVKLVGDMFGPISQDSEDEMGNLGEKVTKHDQSFFDRENPEDQGPFSILGEMRDTALNKLSANNINAIKEAQEEVTNTIDALNGMTESNDKSRFLEQYNGLSELGNALLNPHETKADKLTKFVNRNKKEESTDKDKEEESKTINSLRENLKKKAAMVEMEPLDGEEVTTINTAADKEGGKGI